MDGRRQLGGFLAARRSQLRPHDVGLVGYGDRRRVPGLRREELAMPTGAFFPTVPQEVWRRHEADLVPDHLGDGMVHVAMQTWVLRSEGRTILVDTGVGNDKARPAVEAWDHLRLDFLGGLARAGVRPEDVDLVVNTHLHVDHVGWNTRLVDGGWVPTFPNATYLIPRTDFVYWDPANNPGIAGGVNENVFEDSVAPVHAAGQVQLWEGSHTIDAHLRLRAAPGHTPGSSVLILHSGGDRTLFAGDLIHTPLQVMEAGRNSCFCEDPAAAAATRRELLGWAADSNALVLPAHLSGHGALEVERRGGRRTCARDGVRARRRLRCRLGRRPAVRRRRVRP